MAGGAFFLKRARVLKVAGVEGAGADRGALVNLRGLPSISDLLREAAAVEAAREAIILVVLKAESRMQRGKWR